MKKLFTILSGAVAGVALAAVVSLAGNMVGKNVAYANPQADACIKTQRGINVNNQNANTDVRLEGACGKHTLVMKSYYAPSASGQPHNQQVLYAVGDSKVVKSGGSNEWVHFNVNLFDPTCFYQVDLVDISNPAGSEGNPIVVAKTGGNHDCTPDVTHAYACTALGLTPSENRKATISTFTVSTTNATFAGATIDWNDGTVQNVGTALGQSHTYAADGTYTVKATAHFTYTGRFGGVHNVDAVCQAPIKFTTPPPEVKTIFVCEIATKTILQIDEADYGTPKYPLDQYTTDLSKCVVKYINVCDLTTKTIVNIKEEEFDASKHTTDLTKCVTPPVTPPTTPPKVLVNTGAGSTVALAGATGIVAAAAHAIWRRRSA